MSGHAQALAGLARGLYARRDRLNRQLAEVDAQLDQARRSYSDAQGYRMAIRREAFEREVRQ